MTQDGMTCFSFEVEPTPLGYEVLCKKDGVVMSRAGPFADLEKANKCCHEWAEHAEKLREKYMRKYAH